MVSLTQNHLWVIFLVSGPFIHIFSSDIQHFDYFVHHSNANDYCYVLGPISFLTVLTIALGFNK